MGKRVLHVLRALNVGGLETLIVNIYRAIDREKIQFDFLLDSEETGYYEKEILSLGGRIFRIPTPALKGVKTYQKQLVKLMREEQFCAVHSHAHFFSGFVLEAANTAKIPIRIAHSHTTSDGKDKTFLRRFYHSYMKWNLRKNATHVFGCSRDAVAALLDKGVEVKVLPNGFNIQAFRDIPGRDAPISLDSLVIGHVGRFDPVKNHVFFLDTFHAFKQKHPYAKAILVGDGPERDRIENHIRTLKLEDSITLTGVRSDIPDIMGKMDVFLFPSIYEGLGNVVIEAQAAGLPCVVSDSIPKEVDLAMNLVTFLKLTDGSKLWAEAIEAADFSKKPGWKVREKQLKKFGYDVAETAKFLEKVYCGG